MKNVIAYCGLDCSECPAYIATQKDDYEELKKVAKQWSNDSMSFKPEDMYCDGCSVNGRIFSWCGNCSTRKCCKEKQLENCAYCEDYLCDKLKQTLSHNDSIAKERLDKIRKTL